MTENIGQALELIHRCMTHREQGKSESVLRSEIQSRLRQVFPGSENVSWINHYSAGTEAHTPILTDGGTPRARFIDNLVGATSIEYEADLRNIAKFNEGTCQVKEHAVALLQSGIVVSQVRCILSDTLYWYAYDISLREDIAPLSCGVDDIVLNEIDSLQIEDADEIWAKKLVGFIKRHLARERSRPLNAQLLAADFGLEGIHFPRVIEPLARLVDRARSEDSSVELATGLWSRFVDYLEDELGEFREYAYAREVYLAILARLLAANVLSQEAIVAEEAELISILNGAHFNTNYGLQNMVEADYFGWLFSQAHIDALVPIAREIQHDLIAYDFRMQPGEDLFGRLMTQLSKSSQRKLLGQEWTPTWLSNLIAKKCLENLPSFEKPHIVDMCCGSGSILIEILKESRGRFSLTTINELQHVATGFDIDPLAVSLAKTNWVTTLASEIKGASAPITIPVYHADSLFSITPVSNSLPLLGEDDKVEISLDGVRITLPNELLQPIYSKLFEHIIDWAYDIALGAQEEGVSEDFVPPDVAASLVTIANSTNCIIPESVKSELISGVEELVCGMAKLAMANRNGIWAFILRNTYRPGFLTGQFNGLASNPPWLAMSSLTNNPYRHMLSERADLYGIRPQGQSSLHMDLSTTHLLQAIDRYLKTDSSIACLVPGTIRRGHHHEPIRQRGFLAACRPVPFRIDEVWLVEPGTFNYPGAALVGKKQAEISSCEHLNVQGYLASPDGLSQVDISVHQLQPERTAWSLSAEGKPIKQKATTELPQQGADLMPRPAVCVDVLSEANGDCRVETPKPNTHWAFTVNKAKVLKGETFPGHVAPQFLYQMAQSENLLPFVLGDHRVWVALPAERDTLGEWQILNDDQILNQGYVHTARRFKKINARLTQVKSCSTLQQRIDFRRKLTRQTFGDSGYLLLIGAGGKHVCAACIPAADSVRLAIDQTLYWKHFTSEDSVWFYVGMLNSQAITEVTTPFNPKGSFGERHIHTLAYRCTPDFNASNDDHLEISQYARQIAEVAQQISRTDCLLNDPNHLLQSRRARVRNLLAEMPEVHKLESLCAGQFEV